VLVAQNLQTRLEKEPPIRTAVSIFIGGAAPENITGAVRKFQPTHILLIDAADFGAQPGAVELLDPAQTQNVSFSTHGLPVSMLADYLSQETGARVFLLGIQPVTTRLNDPLSKNIETAAENLVKELAAALREVI